MIEDTAAKGDRVMIELYQRARDFDAYANRRAARRAVAWLLVLTCALVGVILFTVHARAADLHANFNPDGSVTFSIEDHVATLTSTRAGDLARWLKREPPPGSTTGAPATSAPAVAPKSCPFGDFLRGRC